MKPIKDFRNDLLKRKEVLFSINADTNPGSVKMQQECAHHFKVEAENVVVKKLWNNFGSKEFFIEAFIYDSIDDKQKIEAKQKSKKESANK